MQRVACRGLHHRRDDDLRVASEKIVQCAVFRDFASKILGTHHHRIGVGHLDNRFSRCDRVIGEERFDPEHPFIADRRRFHPWCRPQAPL